MVVRRRVEVFQEVGEHDDTRVQERHRLPRDRGPGHHQFPPIQLNDSPNVRGGWPGARLPSPRLQR